jgi:hypothetical protein
MTVDGNLSDWNGIAAISMADNSGRTGGVDNTAKVRLAWDDSYLYYAFDVTDTELLAIETARDGANLYKDDEVELYIDPQGDGRTAAKMRDTDYQFLANVRDVLGDQKGTAAGGKDASYNAATFLTKAVTNGTLNATGTDIGYTLEGRIGWTDLGVAPSAGGFMRIDPAVGDRDGAATSTEEFDWANLTTSFNNPSAWKDVKLVVDATAPATPTGLTLTVVSSSQVDVSWTASTSADVAKYNIYRNGAATPAATVAASPYHDTGLTPGTYSYQVSAVDAAGNESAKTAAKSVSTQPSQTAGIPVGPWAVPLDSVGSSKRFTATGLFGNTSGWKANLDQVRAQGGHVFWSPTTDRTQFLSTRPSGAKYFNTALWHNMWTSNWTPRAAELQSYLDDGTIVGVYMMDEPNCSSCWGLGANDEAITQAQVDTLAGWVKADLPTAQIAVRVVPSWWAGAVHQHIDIAWAQYEGPLHTPSAGQTPAQFRDKQVTDAGAVGLGLVFSVNTLDGGDGSSRINGTFFIDPNPNDNVYHDSKGSNYRYQMTAAELESAGVAFAQTASSCFLTAWRWSPNFSSSSLTAAELANVRAFDNRPDVQAAWTNVIAAAKAHAPNPCRKP